MVDRVDKITRSYIMSKIRGKWTNPEKLLHNHLKGHKIKHTMHPKMIGNPDAYIIDINTAVFVDGCFWHGCPIHGHIPKSKRKFWKAKIERNRVRDSKYNNRLERAGFGVLRIWECQILNKEFVETIRKAYYYI